MDQKTWTLWRCQIPVLLTTLLYCLLVSGKSTYQNEKQSISNIAQGFWEKANLSNLQDATNAPQGKCNLGQKYSSKYSDEFAEDLLYFFKMGDEEIELLDEEKDVVLLLGYTGVGKSTLSLIVAGTEDNPLTVWCNERTGNCRIVDEKGLISNQSIISQTLLPNLILESDIIPHTAIYDCPGFGDTRNESVEIANAYFINKVALHANKLKIILVALHSDFHQTARDRVLELLRNVIQIIKDVDHFADGFGIVGNIMDASLTDEQVIARYADFLAVVKRDINEDEGIDFTPEEKYAATNLLNAFLTDESRISFMPTPVPNNINGSIEQYDNMLVAKAAVKNLIWNNTQYIVPKGDDFGFSISAKAKLKIKIAIGELNSNIEELTKNISTATISYILSVYDDIETGDFSNLDALKSRVTDIISAVYPQYTVNLTWTAFMNEIANVITTFIDEDQCSDVQGLRQLAEYISFLLTIENSSNDDVKPDSWTAEFKNIQPQLLTIVSESIATPATKKSLDDVAVLLNEIEHILLDQISAEQDIADKIKKISTLNDAVLSIQTKLASNYIIPGYTLSQYLNLLTDLLVKELNISIDDYVTAIQNDILMISSVEVLGWNSWQVGYIWDDPIKAITTSLQNDIKTYTFLKSLFEELSGTPVQVTKIGELHDWRGFNAVTTKDNIQQMVTKFQSAGMSTTNGTDINLIVQRISNNAKLLQELNIMLDYTLKNDFTCPLRTGDAFVFKKNYIAMSDVNDCLVKPEGQTNPAKVVLLAQQVLFLDSSWDMSKISNTSMTFFVVAPTWMTVGSSNELNLVGSNGSPPDPIKLPGDDSSVGAKGTTGGDGSNFIAVYKNWTSSPVVYTCGGNGGNGQGGANGRAGSSGGQPSFDTDGDIIAESQCAAWSSGNPPGNIQVRIYPNSCNGEGGDKDRCHAGDKGVWVTVEGKGGTPGTQGGIGGKGGSGGAGGTVIFVDVTKPSPVEKKGNTGSTGNTGDTGAQGPTGSKGADLKVLIDDVTHSGKRCKILEYGKSEERFSFNSKELALLSNLQQTKDIFVTQKPLATCALVLSSGFDISTYKTYIKTFLSAAENTINQMVFNNLNAFIKDVNSNTYLN